MTSFNNTHGGFSNTVESSLGMYQPDKYCQPYPCLFMCHTCNKTFKNKASFDSHQIHHDVQQIFESSLQSAVNASHQSIMQSANLSIPPGMEGASNSVLPPTNPGYLQSPAKLEAIDPEPPAPSEEKKPAPAPPKLRLHTCSLCDKSYTRRDHLNRHRLVHSGVRDHVCSVCNKEFYRKDKLKRHEQIHLKDLNLFCRVCGKHCQRKDSLTRHEKTHEKNAVITSHHDLMPPTNSSVPPGMEGAPGCGPPTSSGYLQDPKGLGASDKKDLAAMPKLRLFACSLCDKSYTRKDLLNRHRPVHSGVREHVCSICNKEFYRKDKLKRHVQIHFKDVNLFCRVCGKHCQRKDSLTRHEKTHEKAGAGATPAPAPVSAPVTAPVPSPVTAPVLAHMPTPVPTPVPAHVSTPVPTPVPPKQSLP